MDYLMNRNFVELEDHTVEIGVEDYKMATEVILELIAEEVFHTSYNCYKKIS